MTILEQIKLELGLSDNEQDALLSLKIEDAMYDVEIYTNYNSSFIPVQILDRVVKELVILAYSKMGLEGISYYTEGSKTYTFEKESSLKKLYSYRRPILTSIYEGGTSI